MVLTSNDGTHIEDGFIYLANIEESNWKNIENWQHKDVDYYYYLSNFRGTTQGINVASLMNIP